MPNVTGARPLPKVKPTNVAPEDTTQAGLTPVLPPKPVSDFGVMPANPPALAEAGKKAPPSSPADRATAGLLRLKAVFAMLGPQAAPAANALNIALDAVQRPDPYDYRRQAEVLRNLVDLNGQFGRELTADAKGEFQKVFLEVFVDYLPAVGVALDGLLAAAVATPSRETFMQLEERGRYAASAVAGAGKAENEGFTRLAERFVEALPAFGPQVAEARHALGLHAETVNQTRLDLIGVPNAGLSVEERARLLNLDFASATPDEVATVLDGAEAARAAGADMLASSLVARLPGLPSSSPAQARVADRARTLRASVAPLVLAGSIDLLKRLVERKLDSWDQLGYRIGTLAVSPALSTRQRDGVMGLLAQLSRAQVAEQRGALDLLTGQLADAPRFGEQHLEALNAYLNLPPEVVLRPEVAQLSTKVAAKLDAEVQAYAKGRSALAARVEELFGATRTFVEQGLERIEALPAAQQKEQAAALYQTAQTLDIASFALPANLTANTTALVEAVYIKANPQ